MTVDIMPADQNSNSLSLGLFARDGAIFCNSRQVAEHFGKTNHHVNRDIRNLIEGGAPQSNFGSNKIKDLTGESVSDYDLTRDGFMLLVMGFTGSDALKMKLAYIDQFNQMEKMLKEGRLIQKRPRKPAFDTTYKRLLKIARTLPGFDENQQCLHAARGTFNMTGVNPLEIMGVTSIAAPNNDAYLTATEIGKEIGLSAVAVNKLLIAEGYQVKVQASSSGSDYQVTEKGAPFGRMFDTTRKGGKGSQATLKWSNRIVKHLLPFARPKEAVS